MYQYQFAENSELMQDEKKDKRKLIKELQALDDTLTGKDAGLKETPDFTKKTYEGMTDEEIEKSARAQAEYEREAAEMELDRDTKEREQTLLQKENEAKEQEQARIRALEEAYGEAKKSAENEALRRGLARSSIALEQQQEYEQGKIKDVYAVREQTLKALSSLSQELSTLREEKARAVASLDLKLAADVSAKIDALKKERDSRLEEVLEYNNTLAEKAADYENDRAQTDLAYRKYYDSTQAQTGPASTKVREQKIQAAIAYYDAMDKKDAFSELLSDEEIKAALGSAYTYVLNRYR